MNIYLAHPISGLTSEETFKYFDNVSNLLGKHFKVLSPMNGKDYLRNTGELKASGYKNPISNDHAIFQRDTWMVSQSDIVFCDFAGCNKISIGCCMELAIASWLNKHTIVVMDKSNVHYHAFILESADIVFETFGEAYAYILQLRTAQ